MRKHENVHRLNLELGPKSFQALTELQDVTETASKAETIRLALQVLLKLVQETQRGARITIQRKDGENLEVVLPFAP